MKATQKPPAGVQVTPADLLRLAALYLRQHGWTQGTYYATTDALTSPACAVGAIGMACAGKPLLDPALLSSADEDIYHQSIAALVDYLDAFAPLFHVDEDGHLLDEHTSPFSWNDDSARTAEQVITALEKAADEWDRLHTQGGENR